MFSRHPPTSVEWICLDFAAPSLCQRPPTLIGVPLVLIPCQRLYGSYGSGRSLHRGTIRAPHRLSSVSWSSQPCCRLLPNRASCLSLCRGSRGNPDSCLQDILSVVGCVPLRWYSPCRVRLYNALTVARLGLWFPLTLQTACQVLPAARGLPRPHGQRPVSSRRSVSALRPRHLFPQGPSCSSMPPVVSWLLPWQHEVVSPVLQFRSPHLVLLTAHRPTQTLLPRTVRGR